MGRDLAFRMFARAGAVLGLAAITATGFTGLAGAAPADRPTDPVVLKGTDVPTMIKVVPKKILGFKWTGKWEQIPVQVDERHEVSARTLYPDVAPAYVNSDLTFDVEVYADAKTRSGADADPSFDADDELVFMGGDSGGKAPASAVAPAGVDAGSATRIAVKDPVGSGEGYVYIFKSTGKLDPSAGKDYVDYDFKLTRFGAGDTLIDDYGFSNSNNPEDSTVKTANYELHSTDRWTEDELKITKGGASGTDILDREAASAGGLGRCSRSEYTFSGNWDRGSDNDEGTYIAVKDGPVRAIRTYMGANSGPYVEDVHLYYADREDRSINVRVHPIPLMYVWTDYNESAIGMTYRDQKNQQGVKIDGLPGEQDGQPFDDSIDKATTADFDNGTYLWQQVTGAAGTTTTLVTADSSATPGGLFNGFAGYYLDDSTPSSSSSDSERQCGGDMKAYGASGFGIDGVYPNTDPNLSTQASPAAKLSVDRIRYFGAPNGTAAEAEALRARAQDPLEGSASAVRVKPRDGQGTAGLAITLASRGVTVRPGKVVTVRLKVRNTGSETVKSARVCVVSRGFTGKACGRVKSLAKGKSRVVTFRPKAKRNLRGRSLRFGYIYNAAAGQFGFGGAAKDVFQAKVRR